LGQFPWREFFVSFMRNLFNALLMALPLFFIVQRVDWVSSEGSLLTRGAVFLFILALGPSLFLTLSLLTRSPELETFRQVVAGFKKRPGD